MARVVQARQVWLTVEPRLPHATSIVVASLGLARGETRFVFVSPQPGWLRIQPIKQKLHVIWLCLTTNNRVCECVRWVGLLCAGLFIDGPLGFVA
jgi:hypothetical protein